MKTTRCLFCRIAPAATPKSQPSTRAFSSTPATQAKGKPAYPNVRAVDLGLVQQRVDTAARTFKPYTVREKQLLALKYTPAQVRAIEAAEASIDLKDVVTQGKIRRDTFALNYIDDLSKIQPLVDKPVRAPTEDIDPGIRMRSEDEVLDRFAAWTEEFNRKRQEYETRMESMDGEHIEQELLTKSIEAGVYPGDNLSPDERRERLRKYAEHFEGPNAVAEWNAFIGNANNFFFSPKGTLHSQQDSASPEMPKVKNLGVKFESEDDDPHFLRLMQQTGLTKDAIKKIRVKNLVAHRVVNQTRMGKIQSQYYLTIAGNENGMLGIGEGKSAEDEDAIRQAMYAAIRNMKPIPRYENRTIYGEVEGKVGASVVQLSSRPPGFGNRCQHLIYEMGRAAGISDLSARCPRSRNPMNIVKATFEALMKQRLPEDVARARGRKMVDVRKVYYQGLTS
ncbi:hypothetical protein D6D18_00216 [Aureobasidium pullulans]|nr:hypothetical protein D6D18_00216 [Aureobasidium pullulans]